MIFLLVINAIGLVRVGVIRFGHARTSLFRNKSKIIY